MTVLDWIKDYLNDFYNAVICWLVKCTYLRATTIWAMMRKMDKQVNEREMEHYISEYRRWKNQGFKTRF